jgi:hypothetical protein
MKTHPVGAVLFDVDGQTGRQEEANSNILQSQKHTFIN